MILIALLLATMWPPAAPPSGIALTNAQARYVGAAIAHDSAWVGAHFGPAATTDYSTCCRFFGYRSGTAGTPVMVRTYLTVDSSHIALLYDRTSATSPWVVVGIIGQTAAPQPLDQIFAWGSLATQRHWYQCWRDGTGTVISTATMPMGRQLVVRYAAMTHARWPLPAHTPVDAYGYFSMPLGKISGLDVAGKAFFTPPATLENCKQQT